MLEAKEVLEAAEAFAGRNASFKKDFDKTIAGLKSKLEKKISSAKLEELMAFVTNGGESFVAKTLKSLPDPETYKLAKKLDKNNASIDSTSAKELRNHLVELTLGKVQPAAKISPARSRSSQPTRMARPQTRPRKVSDQQGLK